MEDAITRRIDSRLEALGLTQRAASLAATGRPDMIRYMKTRSIKPSADKLSALAQVLGVSVDWLLAGDGEMSAASPAIIARPSIFHLTWNGPKAPDQVIINGVRYLPE